MKIVIRDSKFDQVGTVVALGHGVVADVEISETTMTRIGTVITAAGFPPIPENIVKEVLALYASSLSAGHENAISTVTKKSKIADFLTGHGYPLASIAIAVAQIVQGYQG